MNSVPKQVSQALEALWAAGFAAYPVGGCVRDGLLGKTPLDWDICTSARPEETAALFAPFRVVETGIKHGTVTVLIDGRAMEITTFRTEQGYADGRHPDEVAFVRRLDDDLARRDFTVNAMVYDRDGSVIDLFGGQADLAAGLIRCVGEPSRRFGEDALRILRALRFAAKLDFQVEPKTADAVHRQRELLLKISPERIFAELRGLLCGVAAGRVLREFSDVIFTVLPELAPEYNFRQHSPYHIHDVWTHTTMAVNAVPPEAALRLAMLFHDAGKPETYFLDDQGVGHFYGHADVSAAIADSALRRLRCDNATRQEVVFLIRHHDAPPPQTEKSARRLLIKLGEDACRKLISCWRADSSDRADDVRERNLAAFSQTERLMEDILARESCFSLRDLALSGKDLLALGMTPGPDVGRTLEALFREVTEKGVSNDRETLLPLAEKFIAGGIN